MSNIYEDTIKGLSEAIDIKNGEIELSPVSDMPGTTLREMTKKEDLIIQLEKEIKRSSMGTIPKEERLRLAAQAIDRLDFDNSFQMHKSLSAYADLIVEQQRWE